ncbi:hypothetical protein AXG93_3052s1020 [Marchantia polymorpha subsp. ruderalis]|uniref:Uncharacterized protein n=1 Tax=Marchantia polymorpha subsp. ruderalis TaxID=1480154 RepID=A0A176WKM3_MARPO|nr:hypothetical protein AXG93_3052s1020 [Marchantia polymorpha subsp. ruderalis]
MDKNRHNGEELRGNPMLWTIEHWARVMGLCAGSDGNLMFKKDSVKITRAEEFTFGPLFKGQRMHWSKSGEEIATELTLSEAILEQIVVEVRGTVGNITKDPKPPPPKEVLRSEIRTKTSEEETKTLEITFSNFLQDSVVPLLKYLASSVSGQRRLAKKLNAFLTSSRDVVLNLELELVNVLQG